MLELSKLIKEGILDTDFELSDSKVLRACDAGWKIEQAKIPAAALLGINIRALREVCRKLSGDKDFIPYHLVSSCSDETKVYNGMDQMTYKYFGADILAGLLMTLPNKASIKNYFSKISSTQYNTHPVSIDIKVRVTAKKITVDVHYFIDDENQADMNITMIK